MPLVGREEVDKDLWLVVASTADDRTTPVVVDGRSPSPDAVHEVAVSRHTAEKFDLDVGTCFSIGFYSPEQFAVIDFDSTVTPGGLTRS